MQDGKQKIQPEEAWLISPLAFFANHVLGFRFFFKNIYVLICFSQDSHLFPLISTGFQFECCLITD